MELDDFTPKTAEKVFEGEGGAYYAWSTSEMPLLAKTNVAAGWLLLQPGGFALPHYADSNKLGYVLQGTNGVVGMVLPNTTREVVLKLKKGDVIPVPIGTTSWWFNSEDSQDLLTIVFLGETSQALIPGQFTYFFLTGALGILGGYSTQLITKLYNLTIDEATKLTKSQSGLLIIKLPKDHPKMPQPQIDLTLELVYNLDGSVPNNDHGSANHGGSIRTLTKTEFPFVGQVGLSVVRVRLEPHAIKTPVHTAISAVQMIYIARGDGWVEVVGMNGKNALNSQVKAGQLIIIPQFYGATQIASEDGMESFSILTTTKPAFVKLAGRASIWEAISPAVQEVALNVDSEFEKLFLSKVKNTTDIIPPFD